MRTQEQITKINSTKNLETINVNKTATIFKEGVYPFTLSRKELKEYLKTIKTASFKVEHTAKVVDSMIKLLNDNDFNIDIIEKETMSWGAVKYWAIIKK